MSDKTISARKDVPLEHTWNAESVFPSIADWEAELKSIEASLADIAAFKGRLKEGPASLAKVLEERDELLRRMDVAMMYASMSHAVDKTDQGAAGRSSIAQGLYGKVRAQVAFVEPELLQIGKQALQDWITEEPRLAIYEHYFDDLFRKSDHIRSGEVEELLGLLMDPFASVSRTAGLLADADLQYKPAINSQGEEVEVTQGTLYKIMADPDRETRRSAWENYYDAHLAFKNTFSNNLITSIKQNVFLARARQHPSTLEASLFENNIPVAVFHNLIKSFRQNLPTWHRYFAVRRKRLGVEHLQPFDMWAPLTKQRPAVPYEQAVEWICEGLAPMGEDYVNVLRRGCYEDRWVDIYPNQGKTSGAFSYGAPGTHPFIVTSYGDTVFSMSTLAHELGHSMHSYLCWQNQPYIYGDYSLFVAEVASNFHQALVRGHLLEGESEVNFQISVIEEAMANFYRYFLIMPTLARFELQTHEMVEKGGGLGAEVMIELIADLFEEAYGGEVKLDRQRMGITWAIFRHLYADYYVYQYATGISGANALAKRILDGTPGAVDDYLGFLKAGGSVYPLEALKMAGVDLASPQPVEETFEVMAGMVDKLETLLEQSEPL
jgi:oligoendopeptidase F